MELDGGGEKLDGGQKRYTTREYTWSEPSPAAAAAAAGDGESVAAARLRLFSFSKKSMFSKTSWGS